MRKGILHLASIVLLITTFSLSGNAQKSDGFIEDETANIEQGPWWQGCDTLPGDQQNPCTQVGWKNYVSAHLKYPPMAQEAMIEGRVWIRFTIGTDGTLSDFEIARGVHNLIDGEAMRVVKSMPNWVPAVQRGKTVEVRYVIPVKFELRE